ncbi:hypothetical protein [Sphingomonas psychrolutea]|uniref:PepSY domain-containing protein n=1 Tax=Sphingomonas psychrolutea TaxID=1259676 RepID=A0ABQ1GAY3_9SPHN|nr:hypothetical protein [Sphingomonas psychrolutea]GGA40145.1 hypothetical protein GCM10011395_08040 [Sphingomonas psychrolutea]
MDVQAAVAKAKSYVTQIFGPEGATNIGLEEVRFDDEKSIWNVTIGFTRPWDNPSRSPLLPIADKRTYKAVEIDDGGNVLAVRNRHATEF